VTTYTEVLAEMGLKFGYGKNDVFLSGGAPFEFMTELLSPGYHRLLDESVATLTFPDYRKARKFHDVAKAKGLRVSPHRHIKKSGINYVRTKHYRDVLVRQSREAK
jgi:hypothetical protein